MLIVTTLIGRSASNKNIYMRIRFVIFFLSIISIFGTRLSAQTDQDSLVQFSGMILDGSNENLYPIPYVNVAVKNKARGTYSDYTGFFSIVIEKTDTLIFSSVGYESVEITVPDSLTETRYSLIQLMTQDTFNLPETVVFPWPSKEHFKLEFLALDVTQDLQERAMENLAKDVLAKVEKATKYDGTENANYYLREQARKSYYIGQTPPMNIFNPIAWGQFFKAWKNGDFKKKEEK